jgi:hypothetical protein
MALLPLEPEIESVPPHGGVGFGAHPAEDPAGRRIESVLPRRAKRPTVLDARARLLGDGDRPRHALCRMDSDVTLVGVRAGV